MVRPGQHVATDLGHGVVQGVNGRWADVEFLNGEVYQIYLGDLEAIDSKLPEMRELEEWFANFDLESVLNGRDESLVESETVDNLEDLEEADTGKGEEEDDIEIIGGDKGADFIDDVKVAEDIDTDFRSELDNLIKNARFRM